jgi:hypothetical protein
MKVITRQPVNLEQVKNAIAQQFPNYQCSYRTSSILVVKKTGTAAALVMVRKEKVIINEGFPTMGGQMLFTLSILLLGFLIPLIVYFAAFAPKQKAVRNEIAAFVQATFA